MNSLFRIGAAPAAVAVSLTALTAGPARAGEVTLTNDDVISGVITSKTDQQVVVEHADLGELEIPMSNVAGVTLEEDTDPAWVEPPVPDFFWGWDKSVEAGVTGSDGNSDTLSAYGAFNTGYEDKNDRWQIKANVFYGENEGINNRNEWEAGVIKDWLLPAEKYFYWTAWKYEHDRFTGWEDRVSGFLGIGYELLDEEDHQILGRLGAGANYEFGDVNDLTPELFLGIEGTVDFSEDAQLKYYTYFYPSLDPAFSEFRNISGLAYKVSMDTGRGMSLKIGAENEYNSEVEPGTEENDLKYYAALVYDF